MRSHVARIITLVVVLCARGQASADTKNPRWRRRRLLVLGALIVTGAASLTPAAPVLAATGGDQTRGTGTNIAGQVTAAPDLALAAPGWSIQSTPPPAGPAISGVSGVSCPSATACVAVGFYVDGSATEVTLGEEWDGTAWAIQPTPNPAGSTRSDLYSVSCTSATSCVAVGFFVNSSGTYVALTESWNGTAWAIQPTPTPTGALQSFLTGVSCIAAAACIAVGYYLNSAGTDVTLAEQWEGTDWALQPTPSGGGVLSGVSCTSATACMAVGKGTLAESVERHHLGPPTHPDPYRGVLEWPLRRVLHHGHGVHRSRVRGLSALHPARTQAASLLGPAYDGGAGVERQGLGGPDHRQPCRQLREPRPVWRVVHRRGDHSLHRCRER